MQALRRAAAQVLASAGTRGMAYSATPAQLMGKTAHGSGLADRIGMLVMLPLSAGFVAYDVLYPEEEFEGKLPEYPYLRIRTRETFPWRTDRGPFEHHREFAATGLAALSCSLAAAPRLPSTCSNQREQAQHP